MPLPVWRVDPRSWPITRSGCVTSPTTSCGPASSASNVGSAKVPVPIMTKPILAALPLNHRGKETQRRQERKRPTFGLLLCVSLPLWLSSSLNHWRRAVALGLILQALLDLGVGRVLSLLLGPAELAL